MQCTRCCTVLVLPSSFGGGLRARICGLVWPAVMPCALKPQGSVLRQNSGAVLVKFYRILNLKFSSGFPSSYVFNYEADSAPDRTGPFG